MINAPHWTTYLSALLMPTVALLGFLIAYRQWRTAQNKLKLELFERRLAIYSAALQFLWATSRPDDNHDEMLANYWKAVQHTKWLLNTDIADYFERVLYNVWVEQQVLADKLKKNLSDEERKIQMQKMQEIWRWFSNQEKVLDNKFAPYLKIGH